MSFPAPRAQPLAGHLGRWGIDPLSLLDEGAATGQVFSLRLWRRVVVGFSPAWNRFVLGDLDTFRSKGSMSGLSPYLAGGLVQTDPPDHRPRRRVLNPPFHRKALLTLQERIAAVVANRLPEGPFDAAHWSSALVRELLAEIFFAGQFSDTLLAAFLAPLDRSLPAPFLRRPRLFGRMNAALQDALRAPRPDTLIAAFAAVDRGVEEARVALSAAYDTTAHTMAWLLWHLADHPERGGAVGVASLVEETLRLYPAGWVGSRITTRSTSFEGVPIPAGTMVLYSPYLTHRDKSLWPEPLAFRPERFDDPLPAWGFIPFAAGERTCLGMHLARMILQRVALAFGDGALTRTGSYPGLRAGVTLSPAGPVRLSRRTVAPAPRLQPPGR